MFKRFDHNGSQTDRSIVPRGMFGASFVDCCDIRLFPIHRESSCFDGKVEKLCQRFG